MNIRPLLLALGFASAILVTGCDRADDNNQVDAEANDTQVTQEAKETANTAGDKIDDGVITTKVKSALLADDTVKGLDINVDTKGGEVSLNGTVDSQAQVDRAVQIAQGIEGVAKVTSQLTVKADANS
jgi:hyperosmotically inducible protein